MEGLAIIVSAPAEIQYPPDAAALLIETTKGFPFSFSFKRLLLIFSEADALPPPESIRRTTPFYRFILIYRFNNFFKGFGPDSSRGRIPFSNYTGGNNYSNFVIRFGGSFFYYFKVILPVYLVYLFKKISCILKNPPVLSTMLLLRAVFAASPPLFFKIEMKN